MYVTNDILKVSKVLYYNKLSQCRVPTLIRFSNRYVTQKIRSQNQWVKICYSKSKIWWMPKIVHCCMWQPTTITLTWQSIIYERIISSSNSNRWNTHKRAKLNGWGLEIMKDFLACIMRCFEEISKWWACYSRTEQISIKLIIKALQFCTLQLKVTHLCWW